MQENACQKVAVGFPMDAAWDPLSGGLNGDFLVSGAFHLYLQKTSATDWEIFA
jgi:hypothetical protein